MNSTTPTNRFAPLHMNHQLSKSTVRIGPDQEEDLGEDENGNLLQSEEERQEEEEQQQLEQEERDREIERTYDDEDESDKKDWARF
ncbi:MAG: hypothetical protein ACK5RG_13500 [Cyclobacteriaceae bacterium]|jgi:hypothetical protein|nr:hypothetical protein [Flammeovirgaceae bacterium]